MVYLITERKESRRWSGRKSTPIVFAILIHNKTHNNEMIERRDFYGKKT